jgi:hypothetical protein
MGLSKVTASLERVESGRSCNSIHACGALGLLSDLITRTWAKQGESESRKGGGRTVVDSINACGALGLLSDLITWKWAK